MVAMAQLFAKAAVVALLKDGAHVKCISGTITRSTRRFLPPNVTVYIVPHRLYAILHLFELCPILAPGSCDHLQVVTILIIINVFAWSEILVDRITVSYSNDQIMRADIYVKVRSMKIGLIECHIWFHFWCWHVLPSRYVTVKSRWVCSREYALRYSLPSFMVTCTIFLPQPP